MQKAAALNSKYLQQQITVVLYNKHPRLEYISKGTSKTSETEQDRYHSPQKQKQVSVIN